MSPILICKPPLPGSLEKPDSPILIKHNVKLID